MKSPEMDRRIETYKRFHEGYGEILVQMNVEDTRLGTAEYVSTRHNLDTIELKWGQGAKYIGGEIKVKTLERAQELKRRGYIVLPDPTLPEVQKGFAGGSIKEFERHSRLGFVTGEGFLKEVERLRKVGFKRVTLKTGAYSAVELAMAMRFGSDAKIDLLTIDGAPGGTGMSPWPMMNEWGIPSFYLQCLTMESARLAKKEKRVPDIAIAGGFATEDGVFKALAMGGPFVKAVCMGRGLMIPGMVGKNIGIGSRKGPPQHGLQVRQDAGGDLRHLRGDPNKYGARMKRSPRVPWASIPTASGSGRGSSSSWQARGTSPFRPSPGMMSWPSPKRRPGSRVSLMSWMPTGTRQMQYSSHNQASIRRLFFRIRFSDVPALSPRSNGCMYRRGGLI